MKVRFLPPELNANHSSITPHVSLAERQRSRASNPVRWVRLPQDTFYILGRTGCEPDCPKEKRLPTEVIRLDEDPVLKTGSV